MASEYKLRWFPLTSSLAHMPCVDYIPENTGTQVCSLQLIEHRGLRVKLQIMEWYMSSAMFILHIWLLISCHSRHLKLSNSVHNVGVGVKTLNCLFPVTCCVNSCTGDKRPRYFSWKLDFANKSLRLPVFLCTF
jgi:hypothetical protein